MDFKRLTLNFCHRSSMIDFQIVLIVVQNWDRLHGQIECCTVHTMDLSVRFALLLRIMIVLTSDTAITGQFMLDLSSPVALRIVNWFALWPDQCTATDEVSYLTLLDFTSIMRHIGLEGLGADNLPNIMSRLKEEVCFIIIYGCWEYNDWCDTWWRASWIEISK